MASIKGEPRNSCNRYEKQSQFLLLHDPHRLSDFVILMLVMGGRFFHCQSSYIRGTIWFSRFFFCIFISVSLSIDFFGIFSILFWCFSIHSIFLRMKFSILDISIFIGARAIRFHPLSIWIDRLFLLLRMRVYGIGMVWSIYKYIDFSILNEFFYLFIDFHPLIRYHELNFLKYIDIWIFDYRWVISMRRILYHFWCLELSEFSEIFL